MFVVYMFLGYVDYIFLGCYQMESLVLVPLFFCLLSIRHMAYLWIFDVLILRGKFIASLKFWCFGRVRILLTCMVMITRSVYVPLVWLAFVNWWVIFLLFSFNAFLIHTFLVQEGNCASELLVWMHVLVICFVMLGVSFTYKFYPRFNFKFF